MCPLSHVKINDMIQHNQRIWINLVCSLSILTFKPKISKPEIFAAAAIKNETREKHPYH